MTAPRSDTGPLLVVPVWLLGTAGVGARELQVYLVLAEHADNETGEAWPSRRRIAERCGVASVRTVDAALDRLVAVGALRVARRRDARGDWTTSLYTVLRARPGVVQPVAPGGAADCTTGRAAGCTSNSGPAERREETPLIPPRRRRDRREAGDRFADVPRYDADDLDGDAR